LLAASLKARSNPQGRNFGLKSGGTNLGGGGEGENAKGMPSHRTRGTWSVVSSPGGVVENGFSVIDRSPLLTILLSPFSTSRVDGPC